MSWHHCEMKTVNKSADTDLVRSNQATSTTTPKNSGKFKDSLSLASTALPITGAVGTLAVWLAANFYVGEIQVTPDRPFNTLEVRVSDKKGQESVFHTPHFQLMPGQYHLEVTVDSQFKHHADIKAVFQKNTDIAVHVPAATSSVASAVSAPGGQSSSQTGVTPAQTVDEDWGSEPGDKGKKHWWQFWKKATPDK